MGKKLKRGKVGNVAQYLTRTQAIRKLQLRLGEFRRICILKGVHPREPKKKVHGANKTYYHVKDINWLLHEPLLETFRKVKVQDRRIKRAKAKWNHDLAERLRQLKPTYKLDHLVKERYPSFVDAIRDLDDPLTMVNLFATLPAEKKYDIPAKAVTLARRLAMEFNAYVVRTNSLRRMFVSVKGYYFQAEILGQSITWLVPHQLSQVLPKDVDYKVMLTFLEFYETLLQFVNFKLYNMLQLKYPPSLDPKLEEAAEGLAGIMKELAGMKDEANKQVEEQRAQLKMLEDSEEARARLRSLGDKMKKIKEDEEDEDEAESEEEEEDSEAGGSDDGEEPVLFVDSGDENDEDEDEDEDEDDQIMDARRGSHQLATTTAMDEEDEDAVLNGVDGTSAAGGALGVDANDESAVCAALFKGMVFFLAREVPREPLLLVIRAFGGIAAWDGAGSPYEHTDEAVTHQVVDRPTQGHKFVDRAYIQPQWVFDSANFRVLMPPRLYVPGKAPPPHLSPFVNDDDEGYTPDFAAAVKKLQAAAQAARMRAAGLADDSEFADLDEKAALDGVSAAAEAEATDAAELAERIYNRDLAKELRASNAASAAAAAEKESEDEEDGEDEDEDDEQAEAKAKAAIAAKKRKAAELEEAERSKMKDIMMTRKNRKLYERINRAIEGKKERSEVLEEKKRSLKRAAKK